MHVLYEGVLRCVHLIPLSALTASNGHEVSTVFQKSTPDFVKLVWLPDFFGWSQLAVDTLPAKVDVENWSSTWTVDPVSHGLPSRPGFIDSQVSTSENRNRRESTCQTTFAGQPMFRSRDYDPCWIGCL